MRKLLSCLPWFFLLVLYGFCCYGCPVRGPAAAHGSGISPAERPALIGILESVATGDGTFPGKADRVRETAAAIDAFHGETEAIIRSALERNELVLQGPAELGYVNVYDARCRNGFLTSTYFLLLRNDAGEQTLPGNFVIQMQDEKTIEAVYRWV